MLTFTVDVFGVLTQPAAEVPVTVYMVKTVGETTLLVPDPEGAHV